MPARVNRSAEKLSHETLRTFAIASVGAMLENYDFVIFVFFSEAIGKVFFPPEMPVWLRQVQVFGVFGAGYLARPLGGLVMAHFGDMIGRKRVFVSAVLLMAIPTFAIGCLPPYARIGYAAPCLLLACRVLQGAALGGEIPGAWVFVSEHAPRRRIGFACGLLNAGLSGGIVLGSLFNTGVALAFTPAEVAAYAWRLPFLLGGVLGLFGMLLRRKLAETPVFEALRHQAKLAHGLPLGIVVRDHIGAVLVSIMAAWFLSAVIIVLMLLAPKLLGQSAGLEASSIAVAGLVENIALVTGGIVAGAAIDRFGLKPVVWVGVFGIAAAAYLLFGAARQPGLLLPVFALVGAISGMICLVPVVMLRAFPAPLAFTGVSLSYNAAQVVAGGLTPPLVAYISHIGRLAPAHYVALVCMLSAAVILPWLSGRSAAVS